MKRMAVAAVFFLGLLVGAVGVDFGGGRAAAQTQAQTPIATIQRPSMGRFEIVISPHSARDTFLLDTQTGKTWRPVRYTDLENEPVVWKYLDRVDNDAEFDKWWHSFTPKKTDK